MIATGGLESFKFGSQDVEVVDDFVFLGSSINSEGSCEKEIRRLLALERRAAQDPSPIMKDNSLPTALKVRLVYVMVFPVVMYGCESWTPRKSEQKRIKAEIRGF